MNTDNRKQQQPQTSSTVRVQSPDVIVAVGSGDNMQEFECYKINLSFAAEYFDIMLSSGMVEDTISRISFPDKDPETWKEFYKLIDPSQIAKPNKTNLLTMSNVVTLLPWFEEFQMKDYLIEADKVIEHYLRDKESIPPAKDSDDNKSSFWNVHFDEDIVRLTKRQETFTHILELFNCTMICRLNQSAYTADEIVCSLLKILEYTIDLFTPDVVKMLVPYMVGDMYEVAQPYAPPPGSSIRIFFDELMLPHIITGNEGEDWNVSQDFIDGNKGWCISPDIVKNNPIFPLLVHSYLEQEAQRQQTESAKKIANKVVYDICTNMRQGRSISDPVNELHRAFAMRR